MFNSLALLSDAAHMFTDARRSASLWRRSRIGQRPADDKRTFGYRRFEILAAAFNALLLFAVAGYVLWEGIQRSSSRSRSARPACWSSPASAWSRTWSRCACCPRARTTSLNVKGAYLEVWADMLGSLGVIAAAVAIYFTGWLWLDPVVAIGIGLWVLPRTWVLLRDTTNILLQGVPRGMDLDTIRDAINRTEGVAATHDLHLWSVAGDDASLTAHIVLAEGADTEVVRNRVAGVLAESFSIHHVTLQVEFEPCSDSAEVHA